MATGLSIQGQHDRMFYQARFINQLFKKYEDVPPIVIQTLLIMENRELGDVSHSYGNPVIEWDRLAKAGMLYIAHKVGLPAAREGGSTLATQLEKYRHSANGRTNSVTDRLQQMTGASLRVYREGRDTRRSSRNYSSTT